MTECELSPQAHAFSTVLTAFIGSVVNGLTSGAFIAFVTGWIAWLAVIRVLVAAVIEYWQTFRAGTKIHDTEYETVSVAMKTDNEAAPVDVAAVANRQLAERLSRGIEHNVTFLGWFGWLWSALYTPISQTIWLVVNMRSAGGGIAIARAIAIGVSALGLTFDNKQRYAAHVGRKWGSWAFVAFNTWNATACLLLGAECAILLVRGAIKVQPPVFVYIIYPVFSCVWAALSFKLLPITDGSRKGVNIFVDVLVGAFAGIFVAAPALVMWQDATFAAKSAAMFGEPAPEGLGLGAYLSCTGTSFWDKFAAVMP